MCRGALACPVPHSRLSCGLLLCHRAGAAKSKERGSADSSSSSNSDNALIVSGPERKHHKVGAILLRLTPGVDRTDRKQNLPEGVVRSARHAPFPPGAELVHATNISVRLMFLGVLRALARAGVCGGAAAKAPLSGHLRPRARVKERGAHQGDHGDQEAGVR